MLEGLPSALLGGALIGIAATLYWTATGRAAGVSGIVRGAIRGGADSLQPLVFVAGLVLAGLASAMVGASAVSPPRWTAVVLLSGVLVGFGTRVGGGCTSGHGVCGLSRFSGRSLVAVVVFIATGALTVWAIGPGSAP